MTSPGAVTDVSIVIPHFGAPEPTLQLLADLARQQTDGALEIIVVDDASPEAFPDVDGVRVVRRSANGGFGSAVNSGVAEATRPLLLFLNSDLRLEEDFVESMGRGAARHPRSVVAPMLVDAEGVDQHSARRFPRVSHQVVEWLTPLARFRQMTFLQRAVGYDLDASPGSDHRVDWLVGAALCLPTDAFRDVGGFDETFYMNCEEVDLQRRLGTVGVPSVLLGDIELTHLGGGSSSGIANRRRWVVSARRRYAAKWGGLRRLQAALTCASGVNLLWNGGRRLLGRPVRPIVTLREELRLVWGHRLDH